MSRAGMISIAVLLMILSQLPGCKSTMIITNRTDPLSFGTLEFIGSSFDAFSQIEVSVPEEIRKKEYQVKRIDIFVTASVDTLYSGSVQDIDTLRMEMYLGLESGSDNLDNPELNNMVEVLEISEVGRDYRMKFHNPRLAENAFRQESFYIKVRIKGRFSSVISGVQTLDNIYFIAEIVRDTGGLASLLYYM